MVFFTPFIGAAAILSGLASAAPMMADGSAAMPGTPAMDSWMTTETAKPSWASSAMASMKTPAMGGASGGSWGGSGGSWGSSAAASSATGGTWGSSAAGGSWGSSSSANTWMAAPTASSAAGYSWGSSAAGGSWESSSSVDTWMAAPTASSAAGGSWGYSSPSWGSSSSADTWTTTPASTWMASTVTTMAQNTYSTPAYGSGSWGGSSSPYDSCVQQCIASYGSPMASYTPPTATSTMASSGTGTGMTHTVIVAPTQGVLRYVPFAVNASVGDTVMFVWNANEHTVTKSSELAICNETSASPFASGEQNKSFTFTQMVNDTNSTFFYCGTPGHCEKGMFGIINPPNAAMGSNTSLSSMMPAMVANSSSMSAMWSYTNMMTSNNSAAASWGGNIDMSSMPEWAMSLVAENVMYSRTFLAANPDTLDAAGNVNLGAAGSAPLMVPMDITAVMSNSTSNSTGAMAAGSSPSTSAGSTTPTTTNGAQALASPNMLAGLITLAAIAFAL